MPLVRKRVLAKHTGAVTRARWTDDGRYVITCGHDKTLRLWNPLRSDEEAAATATGPAAQAPGSESALQIKAYSGPHGQEVSDVCIAKDNASFVSCGGDRHCFLWDVTKGTVIRRFEGHTQRVNAVCFNAEDSVLCSASYDQTVRLWDMRARNREPIQILSECKDSVTSVCTTAHEVVTGCVDGSVRTHDLRMGECRADALCAGPVTCASVSRDGKCILASCLGQGQGGSGSTTPGQHTTTRSSGAVAILLDKEDGRVLQAFGGHAHDVYGVESALAHDDSAVVSGSEDGAVHVWDLVSGELLQKLTCGGHAKAVTGVAAHPSEARLVSASLDGTAAYWEGTWT